MLTIRDLAWAAGFLEGEGDFSLGNHAHIRASQVEREPLDRLQRIFGGSVKPRKHRNGKPTWSDFWSWSIDRQAQVSGICMTLYVLMSSKRQKRIRELLAWWKPRPLHTTRLSTTCYLGHPFDEQNTYWHSGSRHCRKCCAIRMQKFREKKDAERDRCIK